MRALLFVSLLALAGCNDVKKNACYKIVEPPGRFVLKVLTLKEFGFNFLIVKSKHEHFDVGYDGYITYKDFSTLNSQQVDCR